MEVHHHPNVEKKNFKEYFLEFVMIFLAAVRQKQLALRLIDLIKKDTILKMNKKKKLFINYYYIQNQNLL